MGWKSGFKDNPNVSVGGAASVSFMAGINAQNVIGLINEDTGDMFENIYFNFKFGYYDQDYTVSGNKFEVDFVDFGIGANYQWIAPTNDYFWTAFKWRGVNFGAMFVYQESKFNYTINLSEISQSAAVGAYTVTLSTKPSMRMGLETTTCTVPAHSCNIMAAFVSFQFYVWTWC